ncbi:hypothetical protein QYF61_003967 [Mycteria americana]|uniref:Uncharacterized protein n=1 Tax=Mycteria americana TaxID=33587 RepID=A0AAN7MHA8_MYCAM|nr:hypothetical protein QYF61_003967 [Mycteria americana]
MSCEESLREVGLSSLLKEAWGNLEKKKWTSRSIAVISTFGALLCSAKSQPAWRLGERPPPVSFPASLPGPCALPRTVREEINLEGLLSATLLPHVPEDWGDHNFMVATAKADTGLPIPEQLFLLWVFQIQKNPWMQEDNKLSMSKQCTLAEKANSLLCYIK